MIEYRGYYINNSRTYPGSYDLAIKGQGGRIPNVMKGIFTSVGDSKKAIDAYLDTRTKVKGKTNASKATAESGG